MATEQTNLFSATIDEEAAVGSTVISLSYENTSHPERSILLSITPELGSNMFRFRVGELDIIHCELDLLQQKSFTGNFVLWPFPNRVREKRYAYQGQSYSLQEVKRPSGNAVLIHGLVLDRVWQFHQPVVEQNAVSVTTFVDINEQSPLYDTYPFDSRLALTYTLTKDGVTITYHVQNRSDKDLPFGFALHPYFSLLSGGNDTLVSIPVGKVMEADEDLLPTGRVLDVNSLMYAMFDLQQPLPVSHLNLDHVYTDLHEKTAAIINYTTHNLQLHITGSADFTHCVIYTAGGTAPYFCLEHQTCSTDAINLHQQGPELQKLAHLLEIHPGASYSGSLHYTVYFA